VAQSVNPMLPLVTEISNTLILQANNQKGIFLKKREENQSFKVVMS
jgi:hypothetical protein